MTFQMVGSVLKLLLFLKSFGIGLVCVCGQVEGHNPQQFFVLVGSFEHNLELSLI
jgi:hypothetical protein